MSLLVLLGSVPAGLVGIVAEKPVEQLLRSALINAVLLIVFGLVLYVVDRIATLKRSMDELRWMDALTMGLGADPGAGARCFAQRHHAERRPAARSGLARRRRAFPF